MASFNASFELDGAFEQDLQEAVLDQAEHEFIGKPANLTFQFVELVHTLLRAYAQRHGYDIESTVESLGEPQVDRRGNRLVITVGWTSDQMARWEFGVPPHTIDGNPVLAFVWEDPPDWVREEFDRARSAGGEFTTGWQVFLPDVDHPGMPESRAIRDAIHALRRLLE